MQEPSPARRLALAGLCAALYVVTTVVLQPIAFGPVQFRIGEMLKGLVIRWPDLIWAFAVGNLVANLWGSPFGPWDYLFMPVVNLVGGWLAWRLGRQHAALGAAVFALIIAAGVAVVLNQAVGVPWLAAFASVAASELVLIVGGLPIVGWIVARARLPLR